MPPQILTSVRDREVTRTADAWKRYYEHKAEANLCARARKGVRQRESERRRREGGGRRNLGEEEHRDESTHVVSSPHSYVSLRPSVESAGKNKGPSSGTEKVMSGKSGHRHVEAVLIMDVPVLHTWRSNAGHMG